MVPAKVSVGLCLFAYGGNGGIAGMSPQLGEWFCRLLASLAADERISYAGALERNGKAYSVYSDTPITMMRNRAIEEAKAGGFDFVLMLDNDNEPDGYLDPANPSSDVKPFWESSFDFAYRRLIHGIPTVIVAPYCGPPPHPVGRPGWIDGGEVPYLFEWANNESDNPHAHHKLSMLTRNEAARLSGIFPIAAAPTGVSLFALKAFEGLKQPHFYYEYSDKSEAHKVSTEDVTATRDISLYWKMTTGEDVLFANCDSWALHVKTKHVGRPTFTPIETVGDNFADAIRNNWSGNDRVKFINAPVRVDGSQVLGRDQNTVVVSDEFIEQRMREDAEREKEIQLVERAKELEQVVSQAFESERDPPEPDENEDKQDDDTDVEVEGSHKGNGIFTRQRRIGGRLITTIGREIPQEDIENIEQLGEWCAAERSFLPLDTAIVHSDTGQAAAAILAGLPEGSHLFCLDNLGAREHGQDKANAFSEAFKAELETGRVMADIEGRNFPLPHQPQDLDLVFIERFVTRDWLEIWKRHVKPDGVLAGYAGTPPEQQTVRDFAEEHGLVVQFNDSVFAVPLMIEEHA